ncbi:MAG: DNA polymerase III subunit beta [Paludibacteraceae bacterium]|nr:DNA polymerase III subunit beta [Paludibacteraceae bacterium]MCR5567828.1 DNA polymerase III subunit beta [Paludibacteraceae bacterium]
MKFTASSADLLEHLQNISRVINSKNTLPILDHFLFKIQGDKLEMTASDLETTIVTSMPIADVEGEGSICVMANRLLSTLKEFADQPLTFDINLDNLRMELITETGHYDFTGESADQFPELPVLEGDINTVIFPAKDLQFNLDNVAFAASTDDSRPQMAGIGFDISTEMTTVVATDSHKMVRIRNKNLKGQNNAMFILPRKPTGLMRNILAKEDMDVEVRFDRSHIHFQMSKYTLVCRQVEGKYPAYNSVIPTNNEFKLIVKRDSFIRTLRRVAVYSNADNNLVKLDINEGLITVSAQDVDYSISAEEKFVCQYDGQPMTIGFKSPYLLEILNNLKTDEVEIDLQDPQRAALLFPFNSDDSETRELLMLIMPIMI